MQAWNLDLHRNASIARKQQELAPRCGLEERSLRFSETERTLHSVCLGRAMTAEKHDRAIGRDHAALIAAQQVLRVLRGHHQ